MNRRNVWNERYEQGEMETKPPEPVLVSAVANLSPGRALDLACGLGRNSLYLAARGWDVAAVDYSAVALTKLRAHRVEMNIVRADLELGEFTIEPEAYDLIIDCCFLHRPLFPMIRQGVRPGGLFVGVLPLKDETSQKSYRADQGELLSYFHDWQIEHWSEGRRAQLVARKPTAPSGHGSQGQQYS